jgi:hypothetical protein
VFASVPYDRLLANTVQIGINAPSQKAKESNRLGGTKYSKPAKERSTYPGGMGMGGSVKLSLITKDLVA